MNRIYLPTTAAHEWQWLLASPGIQWKHGASAMALADSWEHADGWPEPVHAALERDQELRDLDLLLGLPEHRVPLPGSVASSQTDLLIVARTQGGALATIAVEGKADEAFGDHSVSEWRAVDGKGRRQRLAFLLDLLELPDNESLRDVRYQLLHRTASAVIEARRFGARHAVMLVHSFSPTAARFGDFQEFAALYDVAAAENSIAPVGVLGQERADPVTLHLGWVSDEPRPLAAAQSLGPRFDRAFAFARDLHGDQRRKGTEIPYISHLMGVASLVLDDGGDEDEAIAALLHDAVEDQGGQPTLNRIRQLFGNRVADIVNACSDTDVVPKPPWRERKLAYIAHLRESDLPPGALRVSLADKLHNARAILFDLRSGQDVFARFSADRQDQLWYYGTLSKTFADLSDSPMVAELTRVVDELDNETSTG